MSALTQQEVYINYRFIKLYEKLKEEGVLKEKSQLTESVGMPKEYFSRIEKNKITIPQHFIDKIIDKYQLPKNWFDIKAAKPFDDSWMNHGSGGNISRNKIEGNNNSMGNRATTQVDQDSELIKKVQNIENENNTLKIENAALKREIELLNKLLAVYENTGK